MEEISEAQQLKMVSDRLQCCNTRFDGGGQPFAVPGRASFENWFASCSACFIGHLFDCSQVFRLEVRAI